MKVNGTIITLEKEQSLQDFLLEQNINIDTIAIELNGEIILKGNYHSTYLTKDDTMEIVHFVGGG